MIKETDDTRTLTREAMRKYQGGQWRAPLFCDLVCHDIQQLGGAATVLDIGGGLGFDDSESLQRRIGEVARRFVCIEPDSEIHPADCFHECHNCTLEESPIEDNSVDVAYAAFVLEHIPAPPVFWDKLRRILRPGGIFWGFTMDRRHYFTWASTALERMRVKDSFLRFVQGERHYENYPTFYRCNTPDKIRSQTTAFSEVSCWSWGRVGQCDAYVPRMLRPVSHALDHLEMTLRLPGSLLVVRLVK